jgi:hypothetical protein
MVLVVHPFDRIESQLRKAVTCSSEELQGFISHSMINGFSSSQQRQAVKQFVDAITRLMNREYYGAALPRQSAKFID